MAKRVLLIVVDACASRVVMPAMEHGRLPHLSRLASAGELNPHCSAIFPSITPAATASVITGCYPRDHGIAGDYWYDFDTNEIAYFGASFQTIWNHGPGTFINDFLLGLNHHHLRADTLMQIVEGAGKQAACLNYLIFRGNTPHKARLPRLVRLLPGVSSSEQVYGPSILRLGDLVGPDLAAVDDDLDAGGPLNRYGFTDKATAEDLRQMARQRAFPDFTVAYFPDNDFASHSHGPRKALATLEQVDQYLGELIDSYGGVASLLQELCLVLTGDHSQTDMRSDAEAGIDLDQILSGFAVAKAGTPWEHDDQLVICPNMRMAHIYFRRPTSDRITRTVARVLGDPQVDQVLWSSALLGEAGRGYYVATHDRGELHFWPGTGGPHTAVDAQGCSWSWYGDLRAVDGQVSAGGVLSFPQYPNAFERISCGLDVPNGGHVWITARPGYEFCIPGVSVHPGGSHGSLHVDDSTMPLLLAGASGEVTIPAHPRSVDVVPLCLAVLGIGSHNAIGASHVSG